MRTFARLAAPMLTYGFVILTGRHSFNSLEPIYRPPFVFIATATSLSTMVRSWSGPVSMSNAD